MPLEVPLQQLLLSFCGGTGNGQRVDALVVEGKLRMEPVAFAGMFADRDRRHEYSAAPLCLCLPVEKDRFEVQAQSDNHNSYPDILVRTQQKFRDTSPMHLPPKFINIWHL